MLMTALFPIRAELFWLRRMVAVVACFLDELPASRSSVSRGRFLVLEEVGAVLGALLDLNLMVGVAGGGDAAGGGGEPALVEVLNLILRGPPVVDTGVAAADSGAPESCVFVFRLSFIMAKSKRVSESSLESAFEV